MVRLKVLQVSPPPFPLQKQSLKLMEVSVQQILPRPRPASYLCTVLGFAFKCRGQIFLFKIEKQCAPH